MLLPIALLLLHPQIAPKLSMSADKAAINGSTTLSASTATAEPEAFAPTVPASVAAENAPAAESADALPEEPLPMAPVAASAPMAFIHPVNPMTVSVAQLRAENRRKELTWRGLVIASSGAATFDAWSTRHAITTAGAEEMNPLLRPFAGNGSLYAAIQVAPVLLDFAGRKMMYSRHTWVRNIWWVPQSASFVSSLFCGAHNLAYH
jgi:hypothetical protein